MPLLAVCELPRLGSRWNPLTGGDISTLVTPELRGAVLDAAQTHGYNYAAICEALGISFQRLHYIIKNHIAKEWKDGKAVHHAKEGPESKPPRAFRDILDVPPPRYAKPIPTAKRKGGKWKTAVVFGDTHRPFHDESALTVVKGIIKESDPDLVVHLGDLVDCYTISKYSTDPARLQSLQSDIDSSRSLLHEISQLAPSATKLLLGGNHEDRLRKTIWDLKGAARQLALLRIFQKQMTWPVLLELESIGWDWVDYTEQPAVGIIPKLLLKHGDVVRKWSGWSGRGEWEKHGRSGISGHCHRMGAFYHRDLNGSQGWWEAGCTCGLRPGYMRQPDWHAGCLVVTYTDDWFHVAQVYIENGRAVWRQKEYVA